MNDQKFLADALKKFSDVNLPEPAFNGIEKPSCNKNINQDRYQ